MLKGIRISHRLTLFLPVLLTALAVTVWFGLTELRQSLLDDRREEIKNVVDVAESVVKAWYEKEQLGELTRAEIVSDLAGKPTKRFQSLGMREASVQQILAFIRKQDIALEIWISAKWSSMA